MGLRFYLHRFVACDADGLHDHPFLRSLSLILAGWYYEDRWSGRVVKRFLNYIGPECFHRVVLPREAQHDVWTLFIHSARVKQWGALRPAFKGRHGPVLLYEPQSEPTDPEFSNWHLRAATGAQLRANPALNISGPAFSIELGKNAYAVGLAKYPESAHRHSLDIDQAGLPEDPNPGQRAAVQMG
ncbi:MULTISPECIES: hypothetical protein [unclassified Variovorax]|nr:MULTISPECIES: hypothetical protein [unclassified Variovorax]KWT98477.1 hypothetical protein APY03_0612 [Variovorax sp. WDL1]